MMREEEKKKTIAEREEEVLKFWEEKDIFRKSVEKNKKGKPFVFYEGPPTANGMPGIHHVEARAFKDAVLRYKTMCGLYVPRRAGWDTHGLPVEIQVEKKLGFKTKHDIEEYGIAKFNAEAKKSVWEYQEEWERLTRRMGFWIDMKHPYITYDTSYIESLWWIIKGFWKKGLLYEDFKVVPWCPRCQTGLSSHEVGLGYREVEDTAVYVKFKLKPGQKFGADTSEKQTYILAWTTTPWTLPGNVALAVKPDIKYVRVRRPSRAGRASASGELPIMRSEYYIVAKAWFLNIPQESNGGRIFRGARLYDDGFETLGIDLIGLKYEPLFDVPELKKSAAAYKIYAADFVSATEGTGVVHTAVMYGEDDYQLGKKVGLPTFHTVTEDGKFIDGLGALSDLSVKAPETTKKILSILGDKIFHQAPYPHEYPHCWRCDTPLLYYARKAWWVKTTAVKKELLANNEKINWIPEHLKHGRFGEFLRDVRDWCFSRERYWGTPLPIWKCEKCGEIEVIGSTAELKKRAGALPRDEKKEVDLHRPYVDVIFFSCAACGAKDAMRRTPEVADVWFDSGAMPFASVHWPFSSYEVQPRKSRHSRKLAFPADYICEGVDQTRGWFYSMLNAATLLGRGTPYKNVISMGILLDKNGQKMSKSKGNIVVPQEMADKYGMDALRWYFFTINAPGDEKRFEEKDVALRQRGFVATLWNSFVFWDTYVAKVPSSKFQVPSPNVLDKWILAKLNLLIAEATRDLNAYDLVSAARAIDEFAVNDFSQWYVRRSRRRFQHPESAKEKAEAAAVMGEVLASLAELSAPFAPFVSEAVYQGLRKKMRIKETSVHLREWPKSEAKKKDAALAQDMEKVRQIVAEALRQRADARIKVRQPLASFQVPSSKFQVPNRALLDLIKDEVNVKEIIFGDEIKLDTKITPELKEEGVVREIIRTIQEMRRELGMKPGKKIRAQVSASGDLDAILGRWQKQIARETGIGVFVSEGGDTFPVRRELAFDGEVLCVAIDRVR